MDKDRLFGFHEIPSRENTIKSSSDRSFGIVFAAFFALVTVISYYHDGKHWHWWLSGAALFAAIALAYPLLLAPLNRLWTKFGLLLAPSSAPWFWDWFCITPMIGFLMRLNA